MEAGCRLDLVRVGQQTVGCSIHPDAASRGSTDGDQKVKVPDTGITVVYQYDHESGRVDLLYVGP